MRMLMLAALLLASCGARTSLPFCAEGDKISCYPGPSGTLDVGACHAGAAVCGADGEPGACTGAVVPASEGCNAVDDDCNGVIDDGCVCDPGVAVPCYGGSSSTLGVGPCRAGSATCDLEGKPGECIGEVVPTVELCNGIDDDCDGSIDEGACPSLGLGCADGTREGFVDESAYPSIAACSGGFSVAGLLSELKAQCNHQGGDSGPLPSGEGCSAEDLCAVGFHVCVSEADVADNSPTGCTGAAPSPGLFFVTRQSGPGCGICALGESNDPACDACMCVTGCLASDLTANDVFGCGSAGDTTSSCGILDRFSNNACSQLPAPWSCGSDGCNEAHALMKPGPSGGGVLCCRD
jgi:hypothetical protein